MRFPWGGKSPGGLCDFCYTVQAYSQGVGYQVVASGTPGETFTST